jgi:meiotic recombination protein SPO11
MNDPQDEVYHHDEAASQQQEQQAGIEQQQQEDATSTSTSITPDQVMDRIEDVMASIFERMDKNELPIIVNTASTSGRNSNALSNKSFRMAHCRSFTSVLLVLSYCHFLLRERRTTTTREVYYFFVLHFRNQRECDATIWQVASILQVPRVTLGLSASSKGWYCGSLQIVSSQDGSITDTQNVTSVEGQPITREWLQWKLYDGDFDIQTTAKCIIVVEKEGIYKRLCEDRFFDRIPCIIVTGKGFPDLATRAFVHTMHIAFGNLPVYGVCDCNPYGVGVLWAYQQGSHRLGLDGGDRYSVPIQWLGLRPSQVNRLRRANQLPDTTNVFQELTEHDRKKLKSLSHPTHQFHHAATADSSTNNNNARLDELALMQYKVELEALQWMGMDHMCDWLYDVIQKHEAGEPGWII